MRKTFVPWLVFDLAGCNFSDTLPAYNTITHCRPSTVGYSSRAGTKKHTSHSISLRKRHVQQLLSLCDQSRNPESKEINVESVLERLGYCVTDAHLV